MQNDRPFIRMLLESYIWVVLVLVVAVTIGITLAFDHFYRTRIFTPVYEATVKSICSNIDMWSKAMTTIDLAYAGSMNELLDVVGNEILENPTITDEEISEVFQTAISNKALKMLSRADWYIISAEGVIVRTSYENDLNLDLAKAVPRYWKDRLSRLTVDEKLVESLSYEVNTSIPRLFGYRRLSDGKILEIGLALDPMLIAQLRNNFESFSLPYIERIDVYSVSFMPIGDSMPISEQDMEYFSDPRAEENMVQVTVSKWRHVIYKNWIPTTLQGDVDWSGRIPYMTLRVKVTMNFETLGVFERASLMTFNASLIGIVLLVVFSNMCIARKLTRPINEILTDMRAFQRSPETFRNREVKTNIKEVRELNAHFQKMSQRISDLLALKDEKNKELNESLLKQKQIEEKLRVMATTDELTGLMNRRAFLLTLEKEMNILKSKGGKLVLCFMDMDDLKVINDTLGHLAGDEKLRNLADYLRRSIRKGDLLARFGGDEFVIVFRDSDLGIAQEVLNRLEEDLNLKGVSISYGFSVWTSKDPVSVKEFVNRADRNMYNHKKKKKN